MQTRGSAAKPPVGRAPWRVSAAYEHGQAAWPRQPLTKGGTAPLGPGLILNIAAPGRDTGRRAGASRTDQSNINL